MELLSNSISKSSELFKELKVFFPLLPGCSVLFASIFLFSLWLMAVKTVVGDSEDVAVNAGLSVENCQALTTEGKLVSPLLSSKKENVAQACPLMWGKK